MRRVVVTGGFDHLRARGIRFLQEAAKLGEVTVLLWPDEALQRFSGQPPTFPEQERLYLLRAIRYVARAELAPESSSPDELPWLEGFQPDVWVVGECRANRSKERFCRSRGIGYHVVGGTDLEGFPAPEFLPPEPGRRKVLVTGCYDWFHSGHVRFFEECSAFGDLYVVVGHDANIRLLKGEGHPLLGQSERRYACGSVRYVRQALVSSGSGWLDAEPEIQAIRPDLYVVNEDGDKGGKREFCEEHGIEYRVLKRVPAEGLPRRSSTELRGF